MKTEILNIDRKNINKAYIKKAADLINEGALVAFPTETVYGLGADGLNDEACKKIFKAKGRPADNPLILHISHISMLDNLVEAISDKHRKLFDLWPGPMTLIFKKSKLIPEAVTAGGDTVAIRFPSDEIARALISEANTPIAAPSANISGRPSPTKADDVYQDMNGIIPLIIDGGESNIGIESTVIDLSGENPIILRPGYYTYEFLKEILPDMRLDDSLVDSTKIPKSPGQKYKHYAPKAKLRVFIGENVPDYLLNLAEECKSQGEKVGILAFEEDKDKFASYPYISLGSRRDLSTMSHVLFSSLREMDRLKVDIILAEGVRENHLGKSIMNRMKKAAANDVNYI
ncbi:L-threonylcarbamoyladenylate synthase [Anaerococcus degeneri]|uniref:Threonylcarbamoyl-AMP synthase n=1 Tax=Anaerococcus degeneri TaxID=361500 RepID=A0ABS7Z156_9FIRM|nr:L-threonylcarbamoyladenylate synthase [Anaerococcus degeneri]MBP2014905.1 L-threonylcarbamoyladenylate synthase [Anaerococcus degeneri]MCA2097114.1 threonylcarbamoyl-AMP synthase [Anaerococcus degeneri]